MRDLLTGIWMAKSQPALDGRDWTLLLSQARRARLIGRLTVLFDDRGWMANVPAGPRLHLDGARRLVARQRDEVLWEIDRIRHALRSLDSPIVLLKGAAYLAADLPPWRGRLFADVDVMVAHDHLQAAENALLAAGWVAEKLDPYDERYYREWMHELPPLQHVQRRTTLDLHHTITAPTSRFRVDGQLLLDRCITLPGDGRLHVLAPDDMVLHCAVHLMQDGEFSGGLRDLLDFNDLLLHFGRRPGFWGELLSRARQLGLGVPLVHALTQAQRLFGTQIPQDQTAAVAALAAPQPARAWMAALLQCALRPDHPSCDSPATGSARFLLYVRSHWLRMPWNQIALHLLRKAWTRWRHKHPRSPPATL